MKKIIFSSQVITWFQNRRAKLKRDMEELKKDIDHAKIVNVQKNYLDNIQVRRDIFFCLS